MKKLNGWMRAFVVIAVLWYPGNMIDGGGWATPEKVKSQWIGAAKGVMIDAIETHTGELIDSERFGEELWQGSQDATIERLKVIGEHPTAKQTIFANKVAAVNHQYQAKLDQLPWARFLWVLEMTLVWAVHMALLYGIGWVVAWVVRGFRKQKT